jgi:hypothetical protein
MSTYGLQSSIFNDNDLSTNNNINNNDLVIVSSSSYSICVKTLSVM